MATPESKHTKRPPQPILGDLSQHRDVANAPIDLDARPEDVDAAIRFVRSYVGSSATVNAYRRELERLMQWSWRIADRSIFNLSRDDIEAFVRFSSSPPSAWIGDRAVPRFLTSNGELVPNPKWRPFVATASGTANGKRSYRPSEAAVRSTFAVLSSFYDFLTEEGKVQSNPVALIRQKSKFLKKQSGPAVVRRLTNLQWDYVIETLEAKADAEPGKHERALFILKCLFAMYLRISELVADERSTPTMGDFQRDMDGAWWFHVTGKGNKDRTIAVSDAMLEALKRYRLFIGLTPMPSRGERTPLISKAKGDGPLTSTRQVRRIVHDCFDTAFDRMVEDGLEEDAQDLRAATVHWLRHTGISEDVKIRPREHVRDDAGHASMATTDRYIESDRRERHKTSKKKPLTDL
ncbi:MAG: site-specific integrase [Pseudomonadota bacterium]